VTAEASIDRQPHALRARNAAASAVVVMLACAAHWAVPVFRQALGREHTIAGWSVSGGDFLWAAGIVYSAIVAVWLWLDHAPKASSPLRALMALARFARSPRVVLAQGWVPGERLAVLSTLLKSFFGPLMVMSLLGFSAGAWKGLEHLGSTGLASADGLTWFDRYGFWLALQSILFVDVCLFTIGYLIEADRLGNRIRSVDPTVLGWAAALLCYPPFNAVTGAVLGSQHEDFPQFANATVHVLANGTIIVLMAVYAAASVALGLKASNLTHRGIVSSGPYALVRHPAYTCKNIAWWIGSVPLVSLAFDRGVVEGLMALASVVGWTLLYVLRALTEEDHLRRVDGDYAAYAARVRHRFIPGLF
jgi:protein-S-isoprenylcysteine O-methyltransferase Ste14